MPVEEIKVYYKLLGGSKKIRILCCAKRHDVSPYDINPYDVNSYVNLLGRL